MCVRAKNKRAALQMNISSQSIFHFSQVCVFQYSWGQRKVKLQVHQRLLPRGWKLWWVFFLVWYWTVGKFHGKHQRVWHLNLSDIIAAIAWKVEFWQCHAHWANIYLANKVEIKKKAKVLSPAYFFQGQWEIKDMSEANVNQNSPTVPFEYIKPTTWFSKPNALC